MSYCINPDCPKPKNPPTVSHCQACGAELMLRGRYRMIRALGRGGFGATFLARDELLPGKPPCVIKQLRPSAEAPHVLDMARELFKREAKILGMIGNHPQLPRLLDYFESDQEFYLVQEYINGLTLQQEVKRGGPFTEAGVKQFLCEILSMVRYVHDNHVIHRDIKPANIIRRDQDKKLVLIDFGAVKDKVNPALAANSDQTALTAYAIGTPGYAPPEQMAMRPVYASDIYALGVTCVYLLSGKAPKDMSYDPHTGELLWRQNVHISDHFAKVLQKMLEISVKHRYQSVDAILRDLDLEPYMEGLAQNMAFPVSPIAPSGPVSDLGSMGPSQGGSSGGSPTSRMAAAIRARRERSHSDSKGAAAGPDHNGSALPLVKGGTPSLLSSEDVKQKYAKGRRDFSLQTFKNLDLQRTALAEANFNQSKLPGANLQGADLSNANFGRANLSRASLRNARLIRAYFHYANLEGADLRGANLAHACLSNANLREANLCGADLTGALVSDQQLTAARTNWSTVMPNGRRGVL